jgi:hypothetical protein
MAGPAVGIPLGLASVAVGAIFLTAFNLSEDLVEDIDVPSERDRRDRAFIAGGTLMIAAGAATFLYSSIKLHENRKTRRRLCGRPEKPSWSR